MKTRFFRLKNGNFITDHDIMKAYEITVGTHLEFTNVFHKDYLEKFINYLYTTTLDYELESNDENVILLARKDTVVKAATMYKQVHDCSLRDAVDAVKNFLKNDSQNNEYLIKEYTSIEDTNNNDSAV